MLREVLLEMHRRTHLNFAALLDHCATLPEGAIDKEMEGFGYSTIRLQLHHVIGAERYWVGVIQGDFNANDDEHLYPTLASVRQFHDEVYSASRAYLKSASDEELGTARQMLTWGNETLLLTPAHIIIRTQTHIYHHKGQVVAMCRLLGSPCSGTDYPIN